VVGRIIKDLILKGSTIHTDKWKAYDGLVYDGYKHQRINHSKQFANSKSHINGIENFWGWSKLRLSKFRGVSREHFLLHLKESEFRFNHRGEDLYDILLKLVKKY
jgi:transposase